MKWLNRHPETGLFVLGLGVCFALSAGNIKANMETLSQTQARVRENTAYEMKLRASEQAAQAQAEIAEERYKSGCVFVVASNDPNSYTSLTEGQAVLDKVRGKPLPIGTVVCDANGNTARIINGVDKPVAGEIAFTGNQDVVDAARQKRRSKAKYSQPSQE